MKKTILALAIGVTIVAGTMLAGCQSSGQKVNAAEANVADAKLSLQNAQTKEDEVKQRAVDNEEWRIYRSEAALKIRENEVRIAELKVKIQKPGKGFDAYYAKRIDALEQRNKNLKIRMETYDKNQTGWASFKTEFKHDMEELGQAFKDLTVNNTK